MQRLPRSFYDRATETVARELLGMHLVHVTGGVERVGRIVEVEAYLGPHDKAAHTARGLTPRTRVMFGPPGHAYVYLIYGMHHCMNVVTEREGHGSAVLLRAVEPVRNVFGRTSGPGLLCRAMGIDRERNGHDLLSDEFHVAEPQPASASVGATAVRGADGDGDRRSARPGAGNRPRIVKRPRIGVDYAGHWARRLLRFYLEGSPCVSRP
jgi:DNA-3-methyladenine glycosylase